MRPDVERGIERTLELMRELGVEGEILRHEGASGRTSSGAAEALGVPISRVLKTLIFTSKGKFVAVITRGDRRVNVKALQKVSGLKKPRLARPDEVEALTGFSPGGVPPFAPLGRVPCYVDESVLELDWVIGAAGSEYAGVKFDPSVLVKMGCSPAKLSG